MAGTAAQADTESVWACRQVESIQGIRPDIQQAIAAAVNNCVTETSLPLPNKRVVSLMDCSSPCFAAVVQELAAALL